jgi:hypothetical protein
LVNGIFRDGDSEEPGREMLGTGLVLIGSDSHKRLTSRHKTEKDNMISGREKATQFK